MYPTVMKLAPRSTVLQPIGPTREQLPASARPYETKTLCRFAAKNCSSTPYHAPRLYSFTFPAPESLLVYFSSSKRPVKRVLPKRQSQTNLWPVSFDLLLVSVPAAPPPSCD